MPTRPTAHAPQTGQTHLGDYLRTLYRRRWIAGLTLLVVFVYGAFSTLRKTNVYEAVAQVLIDKDARRATSLDSVLDSSAGYWESDDFYSTQMRIIQSRGLAARAAAALRLKPRPPAPAAPADAGWLGEAGGWVKDLVGRPKAIEPPAPDENSAQAALVSGLLGGLDVVRARGTRIVEVHYRSPDPAFAASAANAFAEQYIEQTLEGRIADTEQTSQYLQDQIEDYKKRVAESERALQTYREQNNAFGLDSALSSPDRLDLTTKLTAARVERMQRESAYQNVTQLQQTDPAKLESLPDVVANSLVQTLKSQLLDLRQQRTVLARRYTDKAPEMIEIDSKIRNAQAKLDAEIQHVVQAMESAYETAKATEAQLQAAVNAQTATAQSLNRKSADYVTLKDEADTNRAMLNVLLERAKEANVSNEYKGTNIKIVDRAEVPRAPILPNTKRDLLKALALGCLLAVALAFGVEYVDNRIRTPEEIKTHLKLPFLGLLPAISDKELDGGKSPLISGNVPPAFAEAIKGIRTAVVFSSADEGARTVVITSTAPSEGKTVVSSNLAVALAQAEQRTLIIDGDMRRPRVHDVFDRLQEPGLSNVLVGTSELHAAVCRTSIPNLFVLSAGHIPPNPAELLGSTKYREIIDDLRHQFDWIIVDAPPVMAVTDAAVVASGATGVVFVVGTEMTSRRHAMFALDQLRAVKAHFIGAVLNRADVQRHSYYYSTYYRKDYTQAYTRSR